MLRLESYRQIENHCWVWKGYRDRKGYGQVWYKGRAHWTHRLAYAAYVGEIPEGVTVDHVCHNPGCFNPEHLALETLSNNSRMNQYHDRYRNAKRDNWPPGYGPKSDESGEGEAQQPPA